MIALDSVAEVTQPAPETGRSRYDDAVAARRAGRLEEAVTLSRDILAGRPDDVDARLNLALSLLALDRLNEAESEFETVLGRSPDYVDARLGLASVARRRGDLEEARRQMLIARALAPGRPDVIALERSLTPARHRVDVDASRSRLSGGLPEWTAYRLALTSRVDERTHVGVAVERTERFDDVDVFAEARLDHQLDGGAVFIAAGGAPEADYRPEVIVRAGAELPVAGPLAVTLEATAARYASGSVETLQPGLAATLADGAVTVGARFIQVWDENDNARSGYAISGLVAVTDRLRLRAGYADAPESSEGVTIEVRAVSLGLDYDLTDRATLKTSLAREDRGPANREEFGVGLAWRF